MEFKLILIPETPDKFLIKSEKPLAGLKFIEEASSCLRRSLDLKVQMRHQTLGTVSQYEMLVPQELAIKSGKYDTVSTVYLPCCENILKSFIFYGASMGHTGTRRACYPYYQDEVVLTSYIEELKFLDVWASRGFPGQMGTNEMGNIPLVDDADDVQGPDEGDLVLDDITKGLT